jgi:hypothetical protein
VFSTDLYVSFNNTCVCSTATRKREIIFFTVRQKTALNEAGVIVTIFIRNSPLCAGDIPKVLPQTCGGAAVEESRHDAGVRLSIVGSRVRVRWRLR